VKRHVAAAGEHKATRRGQHTGAPAAPSTGRHVTPASAGCLRSDWRVAERHAPFDRAAIQIEGHQVAERRLQERQPVHEFGVGVAHARELRVHFRGPRVALVRSGLPTRPTFGLLVVLKYSTPARVSNAAPPQLAPPMSPGRCTVPCTLGGVKSGPNPVFLQLRLRRGLELRREIERIVERHALLGERGGLVGTAASASVLAVDVARRHRPLFDRPHRLSGHAIEDEREPCFVSCTTASMRRPSTVMVTRLGGDGLS
jgi:hypothetical protein